MKWGHIAIKIVFHKIRWFWELSWINIDGKKFQQNEPIGCLKDVIENQDQS